MTFNNLSLIKVQKVSHFDKKNKIKKKSIGVAKNILEK